MFKFSELTLEFFDILDKSFDKLSPRNLLLALGLCQILDIYSKCSVLVQRSDSFPVSTWQEIRALQLSIDMLAEQWQWPDDNLKFAEVGKKVLAAGSMMWRRFLTQRI